MTQSCDHGIGPQEAQESLSDTQACREVTTRCVDNGDRMLSRDNLPLIGLALFAFAWVVVRAHIQFITIDEAENFVSFARRDALMQWYPAGGNHVVNSLLMTLGTAIFGISHLSVRLSALLGAAGYIAAACVVARVLAQSAFGRCIVLILLVYNPFVFDYMVAARGYSIAIACLLGAIAIMLQSARNYIAAMPIPVYQACVMISLLGGLGFSSSFPFAFCFGVICAAAFVLACLYLKSNDSLSAATLLKTALNCVLPGLALAFILVGSVVLNWPSGQLWYGARHLSEMWQRLVSSLLYEPSPDMLNPMLLPVVTAASSYFFPCLAVAGVLRLAVLWRQRRERQARYALAIFGACLLVVSLLVGIHYFAMKTFGLWLPMERTSLFFVPLGFAGICALAMSVEGGKVTLWSRRALLVVLVAMSVYFIGCMRLRYFKEWKYVSDSRAIYEAVWRVHRASPLTSVDSHWRYTAVLNFYRLANSEQEIPAFPVAQPDGSVYWSGRDLYVCYEPEDAEFIRSEGLVVVYRGDISGAVVAVRPSSLHKSLNPVR